MIWEITYFLLYRSLRADFKVKGDCVAENNAAEGNEIEPEGGK